MGNKFNRNTRELNTLSVAHKKVLLNWHNFSVLNINCTELYPIVRHIEAISSFKFKSVKSLKHFSSLKQYLRGFQRFHAGEDVRPVTHCKFLLVSQVIGLFRKSLGRVTEHEEEGAAQNCGSNRRPAANTHVTSRLSRVGWVSRALAFCSLCYNLVPSFSLLS